MPTLQRLFSVFADRQPGGPLRRLNEERWAAGGSRGDGNANYMRPRMRLALASDLAGDGPGLRPRRAPRPLLVLRGWALFTRISKSDLYLLAQPPTRPTTRSPYYPTKFYLPTHVHQFVAAWVT